MPGTIRIIQSYLTQYFFNRCTRTLVGSLYIVALPVLFCPLERTHFTFILGPGIEFSNGKNFSVIRMGVGSEFKLGKDWDFSPELIYDLKDGHINSLTFALGVGKRF